MSTLHLAVVDDLLKVKRKRGIDIHHWLCNIVPNASLEDSRLWREIEKCTTPQAVIERYEATLADLKLDDKQKLFAMRTLKSLKGIVLVSGLSNTGKSHALLATIAAHIVIGRLPGMIRRILVTVSTASAVQELMRQLVDNGMLEKHDIEACLFFGGPLRNPRQPIQSAMIQHAVDTKWSHVHGFQTEQEWWSALESIWDMTVDPKLRDQLFHKRRNEYIKDSGGDDANSNDDPGKDDRQYLQEKVDVVFSTNRDSAHPTLMEHFKPQILVQDDGTIGSKMDSMIPAAAFKDTVELLVYAADHTKQGPPVLSRNTNPFAYAIEGTLFASISRNLNLVENVDKIMLVDKHNVLNDRLAGLQIQ